MLDSVGAHQEDDVGVLVKGSGHADPLPLTSAQVDALHPQQERKSDLQGEDVMDQSRAQQHTRSPISVWSPKGMRSMSGCSEQASITALYLEQDRPLSAPASSSTTEEEAALTSVC